ncbi:MAG: methyltransferase domain-containing protein, partial [Planctomycetes bacterium]|nr:methyltransferase domain-containing protein [Planctomycetota bacterium]
TKQEPMERLLNALVGLGLLTKSKGEFHNTSSTLTHLVDGAPEPLQHIMQHRSNLWESWSGLTEVVRTGKAVKRKHTKKKEESFIRGMADVGMVAATATARVLKHELRSAKTLLDVGGGPAVYACGFADCAPGLKVTVFDLKGPLEIAKETVAKRGMKHRVALEAGDVLKAKSYGKDFDIVFMSNMIHAFKRPDAAKIIKKAADALKHSGHLIIKDFFIQRQGTAPTWAAIFSINMLVADAGDCFSRAEVESWMTDAGVKPAGFTTVAQESALLMGVKT